MSWCMVGAVAKQCKYYPIKGIGCHFTNGRAMKFSLQYLCCVFCDNSSMWRWMIIVVISVHACVSNEAPLPNMAEKTLCPTSTLYHQHPFLEHTSFRLRGVVETKTEKEWVRGGEKDGKKRDVSIWSGEEFEFIVCEFAVVDIRLGAQTAHFPNFVFLKITSLSIWKAITLIGNVTSETELWKTSKITTALPTLSEHMGRITCITSILLMIPVQYI